MHAWTEPNNLASLIGLAATLLMWRWATMGWRILAHSPHSTLTRARNIAVTIGLALCAVSLSLAPFVPQIVAAGVAAIAVAVHAALEPSRETFWHHRRVRSVALCLLAMAVPAHHFAPVGALAGVLAATAVFHQHQRQNRHLMARLLGEIGEMSRRQLRLSTQLRNYHIATKQSEDDFLDQAG